MHNKKAEFVEKLATEMWIATERGAADFRDLAQCREFAMSHTLEACKGRVPAGYLIDNVCAELGVTRGDLTQYLNS